MESTNGDVLVFVQDIAEMYKNRPLDGWVCPREDLSMLIGRMLQDIEGKYARVVVASEQHDVGSVTTVWLMAKVELSARPENRDERGLVSEG